MVLIIVEEPGPSAPKITMAAGKAALSVAKVVKRIGKW